MTLHDGGDWFIVEVAPSGERKRSEPMSYSRAVSAMRELVALAGGAFGGYFYLAERADWPSSVRSGPPARAAVARCR